MSIKARLDCVFAAVLAVFIFSVSAGSYSGGDGSQADPFRLSKAQDIVDLSIFPDDWGFSFILTNDIDMIGVYINPIGPNYIDSFGGRFNGKGFSIVNATVTATEGANYVGLFGVLDKVAMITNLEIRDILIEYEAKGNDKEECYVYAGGIAGRSAASVQNCKVSGVLSLKSKGLVSAGGLFGRCENVKILDCSSDVIVSAKSSQQAFSGGLVGYCHTALILNCISFSSLSAEGQKIGYAGGIAGYALHTNMNSTSADGGKVSTIIGGYSGGLIGYNYNGRILNCYATNEVYAFSGAYAGGIAGGNFNSIIRNCYFAGVLPPAPKDTVFNVFSMFGNKDEVFIGSIAGFNKRSQILNCYWNYDTALTENAIAEGVFIGNVVMLNQEQIDAGGIFTDLNWNADSPQDGEPLWQIHSNKLPTLTRSAVVPESN